MLGIRQGLERFREHGDMAQDRVEAVERALTLLEAFSEEEDTLTLAQLAERSGYYKSTILRLARSLQRFGFVTRGVDGTFRLGPALWRLGSLYRRGFDPGELIRPALRRLRDATGETASFYVRDGDDRVCLYRLNSTHAIRHHLDEGVRLPLDRGAAGHILSAYGDAPAPGTEGVRGAGQSISLGERDPEVGAIAVPVFGPDGTLRGALAVSGLVTHFRDALFQHKAAGHLRQEAGELKARLSDR